ncbi:MAG: hypothetical protein PHG35_03455 [Dehalococcoidales bacterium]|nr:hypothetical protein [Dehalococcoidales bacterium]
MTTITLKCPHCGSSSIIYDRGDDCFKCILCNRPLAKEDFQHLITERNRHGYTDGGRPVKQGKQQYGNCKVKGKG